MANHFVKKWYERLWGANNTRPLSWGHKRKRSRFCTSNAGLCSCFRECITPSHGGLWCYGESTQTTEWIVLSHHGRTFDDAKEHCLLQNGILIENQDSELLTKIAKIFVEDRSDFRDFWVGYKYDKQQITRLSDGIILPYTTLSIWDTGEPSGYNNEFYVKILVKRDDNDQIYVRFHNHVDAIFAFVCDKTPRS